MLIYLKLLLYKWFLRTVLSWEIYILLFFMMGLIVDTFESWHVPHPRWPWEAPMPCFHLLGESQMDCKTGIPFSCLTKDVGILWTFLEVNRFPATERGGWECVRERPVVPSGFSVRSPVLGVDIVLVGSFQQRWGKAGPWFSCMWRVMNEWPSDFRCSCSLPPFSPPWARSGTGGAWTCRSLIEVLSTPSAIYLSPQGGNPGPPAWALEPSVQWTNFTFRRQEEVWGLCLHRSLVYLFCVISFCDWKQSVVLLRETRRGLSVNTWLLPFQARPGASFNSLLSVC